MSTIFPRDLSGFGIGPGPGLPGLPGMPNLQLPGMPNLQLPGMPNVHLPNLPNIGQILGTRWCRWCHMLC
jgi:hypothetical protein